MERRRVKRHTNFGFGDLTMELKFVFKGFIRIEETDLNFKFFWDEIMNC